MDAKVGDVFVRLSDDRVWVVKTVDGNEVLLESPDKKLAITDIYGLAKSYDRVEPTPHD